jgi:hypothetical protein
LGYNARHDLTNDSTYTYGYDAMDRLTSVTPISQTTGSLAAQYGYDRQGRMIGEDVYTYQAGQSDPWILSASYQFVWSGDELVAKLDGNNNLLQQYTWGPGESGNDQVVLLTDYTGSAPHTYELSYDASGNVAMMLDPLSGAVAANYNYDPYGRPRDASGPAAALNPFGFKGYWTDAAVDPMLAWSPPATGYGANRVADVKYGFWLQDDPAGSGGGLNPKEAFGDDPIDNLDLNGLKVITREDISAYLNQQGVTDFQMQEVKVNGSVQYVYSGQATYGDAIKSQILGTMIAANRVFEPKGGTLSNLLYNVDARESVVDAAKSAHMTCQSPAVFNRAFWSDYLTPRGRLSRALADMWRPGSTYGSGCQQNALFTELRGISMTWDIDRNAKSGSNVVETAGKVLAHYPNRPIKDRNPSEKVDVLIPGDWVHVANLDPATNHGGDLLEGENLIYLGGGLLWGSDGDQIHDMAWWKAHVGEWSNGTMGGQPLDKRVAVDADLYYPKVGLK